MDDDAAAAGLDDAGAGAGRGFADSAYLADLRRQMIKFATLQLSDRHLAEDAVQEALFGALNNAGGFRGRSALKTWVFGILKNKIADLLRQRVAARARLVSVEALGEAIEPDEASRFAADGHWNPADRPRAWTDPEQSFEQAQFWRVFEICLDDMPPAHARVFMLREMVGLDSAEICASLGLSTSNLHVSLHRARLRLRACLERRWFARGA
ncbi:MAG: sigma-70 family RNA polymerase sigma factor [Gammaproteobacteria bacterium]